MKAASRAYVPIAVIALIITVLTWHKFFPIVGDSTVYIANAVYMVLGGNYRGIVGTPPTWFPPGLGGLIGVGTKLLGEPVLAGRLISLIASVLTTIPLVLIAERLFGRRVAIAAGLVYAVNPARLVYAHRVSSEATYLLLLLPALLLWLYESESYRPMRAAAAGFFIGAAYYIRPEALVYLPAMLILSVLFGRRWKTPRLKSVLIMCAVAGLLTLPYVRYLHSIGKGWAFSGKSFKLVYQDCISLSKGVQYASARTLNPECTEVVMEPAQTRESFGEFAIRASNNAVTIVGEMGGILGPFLSACLVLGLAVELRKDNQVLRSAAPMLLLMCVQLVHLPVFVAFTRFVYLGAMPFLIVGCWQLATRFAPESGDGKRAGHVAVWLPVALVLVQLVVSGRDAYFGRGRHAEMAMTEMVQRNLPRVAPLLTSQFTVAYLAGNKMVFLPNDTLPRILRYAEHHNAGYALVTSLDELGNNELELSQAERGGSLQLLEMWKGRWQEREDQWARLYRIGK